MPSDFLPNNIAALASARRGVHDGDDGQFPGGAAAAAAARFGFAPGQGLPGLPMRRATLAQQAGGGDKDSDSKKNWKQVNDSLFGVEALYN